MSVTAILGITQPTPTQSNKEATVSTAFDRLEAAGESFIEISISGNYTLSVAPLDTCEAYNYKTYKFTGTLAGAANIIVPDKKREYIVWNATTGGFDITVKTSAGTGVTIAPGNIAIVVCNAVNVYIVVGGAAGTPFGGRFRDLTDTFSSFVGHGSKVLRINAGATAIEPGVVLGTVATLASDTDITLAANSDSNIATQKATKAYVDNQLSGGAGFSRTITTVSTTGSVSSPTGSELLELCSNTITRTLPAPSGKTNKTFRFKNVGTGVVTINPNASETIDGDSSVTLVNQYQFVTLVTDGTNWHVVGNN
jgi:hypothetical protein